MWEITPSAYGSSLAAPILEPQQWLAAALDGSRKAMRYIVDHCVQDVLVLEKVVGALKANHRRETGRREMSPVTRCVFDLETTNPTGMTLVGKGSVCGGPCKNFAVSVR